MSIHITKLKTPLSIIPNKKINTEMQTEFSIRSSILDLQLLCVIG